MCGSSIPFDASRRLCVRVDTPVDVVGLTISSMLGGMTNWSILVGGGWGCGIDSSAHVLEYANDALARWGKSPLVLMEPVSASFVPAMVELTFASCDPVVETEASATPTSPDFGGDSDIGAEEESVFQTETQHTCVDQAVENTATVWEELEQMMMGEIHGDDKDRAQLLATRQEMLPEFIRATAGEVPTPNSNLQAMQAMKERNVEHVRHRAVGDFNDMKISADLREMCAEAYRYHCKHKQHSDTTVLMPQPWPRYASPYFKPMKPQEFIEAAHRRSLQATIFKKTDSEDPRKQYWKLLSDVPNTTHLKVGDSQLATPVGRAKALTQLVALHSGEVVELDRTRTRWHLLRKAAPGLASAASVAESANIDWMSPQWYCREHGLPVGPPKVKPARDEFGRSAVRDVNCDMDCQARIVSETMHLPPYHFWPAWEEQTNRVLVPCKIAEQWQWHRAGPVITLGELFLALGQSYTASAIYSFYRTLRLVVLKRGKQAQRSRGTPGSASVTGMTGSALQAAAIRQEFRNSQYLLTDEYITVNKFSDGYIKTLTKEQLLSDSIQFMYRLLLQDIRPPWLAHDFPLALPGEGVLSKLTRASFLQWDVEKSGTLFGEEVYHRLIKTTDSVSKTFAGVIGRPLFVCMEVVDTATHQLCMNVASMSHYLQQPACRPIYKCSKCVQASTRWRATGGSASPSLRVLWLYPLVEGKDGKPLPLRMASPVRIVVHAPPVSWGLGARSDRLCIGNKPVIPEVRGQAPIHYIYDAKHSAAIWRCSMAFQQLSPSCIGGQQAATAQGRMTVAAARERSRTPLKRRRCSIPFQQRSIGGHEAAAARKRCRTPLRRKRPRTGCRLLSR